MNMSNDNFRTMQVWMTSIESELWGPDRSDG